MVLWTGTLKILTKGLPIGCGQRGPMPPLPADVEPTTDEGYILFTKRLCCFRELLGAVDLLILQGSAHHHQLLPDLAELRRLPDLCAGHAAVASMEDHSAVDLQQ